MSVVTLALIAVLAGGSTTSFERLELRATIAAGTSDLGGLGHFRPALLGGGDAAGRIGVTAQAWWTPRVAFGLRFALASDTGRGSGLGVTHFYRRSFLAETVLTLSALHAGWLDLIVTGGVGVAGIEEGADERYLLDIEGRWGEEMLSFRRRLGPTASVGSGLLVTAGWLSLSALVRFETIGGNEFIDGTSVMGTRRTGGLALTGELGGGVAWW